MNVYGIKHERLWAKHERLWDALSNGLLAKAAMPIFSLKVKVYRLKYCKAIDQLSRLRI